MCHTNSLRSPCVTEDLSAACSDCWTLLRHLLDHAACKKKRLLEMKTEHSNEKSSIVNLSILHSSNDQQTCNRNLNPTTSLWFYKRHGKCDFTVRWSYIWKILPLHSHVINNHTWTYSQPTQHKLNYWVYKCTHIWDVISYSLVDITGLEGKSLTTFYKILGKWIS